MGISKITVVTDERGQQYRLKEEAIRVRDGIRYTKRLDPIVPCSAISKVETDTGYYLSWKNFRGWVLMAEHEIAELENRNWQCQIAVCRDPDKPERWFISHVY